MKQLEIIKKEQAIITINFDEVKADLTKQLTKYEKIVVSAETLPDCVSMQKELAGVRNKIDALRLDIQREMKTPIDSFGAQMKELFQLVVDTEAPIKAGIQVFEDRRKAEKTEAITELLDAAKESLEPNFVDKLIFDAKWLNKGATMAQIDSAISLQVWDLMAMQNAFKETCTAVREIALTASASLVTPIAPEPFIKKIGEGADLTSVIMEINKVGSDQAKAESKAVEVAETRKTEIVPAKQEPASTSSDKTTAPSVRTVMVKVTATEEKLKELNSFLKLNHIAFEKVSG